MTAIMHANAANDDAAEDRHRLSLPNVPSKAFNQDLSAPSTFPPATRSGASAGASTPAGPLLPSASRATFAPPGGMTESPKPLTPGTGTRQARPANLLHGMSDASAEQAGHLAGPSFPTSPSVAHVPLHRSRPGHGRRRARRRQC